MENLQDTQQARTALRLLGRIRIDVYEGGRHIRRYEEKNLLMNAGLPRIAGLLNGAVTDPFVYIALGTGTDPADVADLALQTERTTGGAARTLGVASVVTTSIANDTAQIQATFNITVDFDLTEMGLFDAPTAGFMAAHKTFSAIPVTNGQSLVVTWTIKCASAPVVP